jgi:quinohemoprotein ethanol dehydrogenase
MRRLSSIAIAAGLGLAAAGALSWAADASAQAARKPVTVDALDGAAIAAADLHPGDWLSHGRDYGEQRFSPLAQIDAANVGRLGLAWYADLGSTRGLEATPLVVDGVIYNVQPWNIVKAFDAPTGKQLWAYDPKVPEATAKNGCCDIVTRGVAAWKGKIYVATLDGRLIALDARTGQPRWSVNTFDDGQKALLSITGAPRVFDGKVVIGNAGGESAARGYMTAYDAETGKKAWRFYIVPGDPKLKEAPNQAAADRIARPTWAGEFWKAGGGGNDWDAIIYDPKLKLVYIGTGNAAPWAPHFRNPNAERGDNLFTSSIVALHVEDGSYAWHYQEIPNEQWDYDATAPLATAELKIGGVMRPVIMHAPKNGFFYVLDRRTGKLLSAEPYMPQNWADGVDLKTGRPRIKPGMFYGEKPILITPNNGHNWQSMAFNPQTGLMYFPVNESGRIIALKSDFQVRIGGLSQTGESLVGFAEERRRLAEENKKNQNSYLIAWDPVKQKEAWRVPYRRGGSGGTLTTAGNLVFQGTSDATLAAYDARTGKKLWEAPIQQSPIAAPISYSVDGVQYIAINAGFGGGLAHDNLNASEPGLNLYDYGRLLVFKLDGKASLPAFTPVKAVLDPPPRIPHSNGDVREGLDIYNANCAVCHGADARGGIKDLRRMSAQTHKDFFDIVLRGKRASNGMPIFGDRLSQREVEQIQKYLVARIEDDWVELKAGE